MEPLSNRPADLKLWNNRNITAFALRAQLFRSSPSELLTDVPTARDPTFKLPISRRLGDSKRSTPLKDLGDSTVPLHKPEKSAPHGTKNAELLDALIKKNGAPSSRSGRYIGTLGTIRW